MERARADAQLSRYVKYALRGGMFVSLALLIMGLALFALSPSSGSTTVLGPLEAINSILNGEPLGVISLGILFLIATPLVGVIASLSVFLKAREWRFVLVALAVLAVALLAVLVKG